MLKLLILAALAHQITACCLPPSFQFTVLSESHFGRGLRYRARIIMAADAAAGKAAIFSFSEEGQNAFLYADFRTGRAHTYAPPYGCFESAIDPNLAQQLSESRCVPRDLLSQPPLRITLAGNLTASLFSGNQSIGGNSTEQVRIDALVSDRCLPILVKVKAHHFNSINIFGDFQSAPEPGILDLPAECRVNSTLVGLRKRGAVTLGYASSPYVL